MKSVRYWVFFMAIQFVCGAVEAVPMLSPGPGNTLVGSGAIDTVGEVDEWAFEFSTVPALFTIKGFPAPSPRHSRRAMPQPAIKLSV